MTAKKDTPRQYPLDVDNYRNMVDFLLIENKDEITKEIFTEV